VALRGSKKTEQVSILEKITTHKENGLMEIIINGNLNIHSIDLLEFKFRDILSESGTFNTIAVNCENIDSIDSSGLGMLISLSKQAEKNSLKFYLCNPNRKVTTLFDISNLDRYFNITDIEELRQTLHR